MMNYVKPEIECITFPVEDIIATSYGESTPDLVPIDPDEGVIV